MNQQEANIIAGLKNRDQNALKQLFNNYSKALYMVIFRILKDEEVSNDVLQEAFMKIWKYFDKYDQGKGSLYTWMMNICRNLAIDKTRSKHFKRANKIQDVDDVVHLVGTTETNTDHIGLKELVNELEPNQKKLVDLIYFNGFTQQEASEELEIPLGTVKTRVRKAIQILRKHF